MDKIKVAFNLDASRGRRSRLHNILRYLLIDFGGLVIGHEDRLIR